MRPHSTACEKSSLPRCRCSCRGKLHGIHCHELTASTLDLNCQHSRAPQRSQTASTQGDDMLKQKLTVRLDSNLVDLLAARANRQKRGISNCLAAILSRAFDLPVPDPDRPHPLDERYKQRPRPPMR